MSKRFLGTFIIAVAVLVSALLWLLPILGVTGLEFFNAYYAVALVSATIAIVYIWRGVISKNIVTIKWFQICFGALFLLLGAYAMFKELELPSVYVWPFIAVVGAAVLVLGVLGTGAKKWDQGDNQKVGYKNYHQRKAEEEKAAKKASKDE